MDRPQFSLAGLVVTVVTLAIACAAFMSSSEIVASAAATVWLGLLALGIVGICCRRGRKRVFWIGVTVFGLVYANASNQLPIEPYGFLQAGNTAHLTDQLLRHIVSQKKFHPQVGALVEAKWASSGRYYPAKILATDSDGQFNVEWIDGSGQQWTPPLGIRINWTSHYETGRAVFCILIALGGGLLAQTLFGPVTPSGDGEPKAPNSP